MSIPIHIQLKTLIDNQKKQLLAARPVKKEVIKKPLIQEKQKRHRKEKSKKIIPKKLVYKVLVPEPVGLTPVECASIRALVHIVDPEITGIVSDDKWILLVNYWKELIAKYNTEALRASIPEQSTPPEDSDEEAERTGINLDETDDEEDDNERENPEEFKGFIAPDDEDEEEEGDEGEEDECEEGDEEVEEEEDKKKEKAEEELKKDKGTKHKNEEEEEENERKKAKSDNNNWLQKQIDEHSRKENAQLKIFD